MGRPRENAVYTYFDYDARDNTSKCSMLNCGKILQGNHGSNLLRHFYAQHRLEYEIILRKNKESKEDLPRTQANQENLKTELSQRAAAASTPSPPAPPQTQVTQAFTKTQNKSKRQKNENLDEVFEIIEFAQRKMEGSASNKDEFDFYGQYVASELRSVTNENAVLQAKSLINNILINMRMGKYNHFGFETNTVYSPSSSPTTSTQE